ncbi:unnamed protein product [Leptidea sinapis]|uniref:FLYWCH-type domain-containing protein n=1 Tax=Leptidea sinapis TaxID=189913 RepID=A0A5E4PXC3_9NEOP|nr:unnamed protein product [Leptidea sinapis]
MCYFNRRLIRPIVNVRDVVRLCVGPGGRPRLWVRGKSFYAAHTMRSGVVRWRCTMGGCGCKAYTQKGKLHKLVGEHNHAGRWRRRQATNKSAAAFAALGLAPPDYSLPHVPQFDFDRFDPSAWVTPY